MKIRLLSKIALITIMTFGIIISVNAQETNNSNQLERKIMTAVRVANGSIDVDGRLDDAVWQRAKFVTDFLQVIPVEYGEPTNITEVAIMYDDDAIYIGARMYVDDPENLRMDLSRRDDRGLGEQIIITLDTYLDRRTSYGFGVTTAGVRFDRYNSDDTQHWDFSWDAVWEVRTSVDDKSWIAEFRIPFSQLRFNKTEIQTWGININRWIPYTTEDIFWVPIMPSETGWASRFGNLVGIKNVKPSRRLELMPYVASDGRFTNNYIIGDPYDDGSTVASRLGGDLKMGLGPNLTLDATFNPDFGQVEADPAEVNLSAYETYFSEKRPFFTEGSNLFSAIGPNYFYSRRIGSRPHGNASGDFVDYPNNSTILGAAKVTGRLQSGTSIGGLLAVTDSESAKVFDTLTNLESEVGVEPTTTYGVLRVKQDFGDGGSTAGIILTGLTRTMDDDELLAQSLTKQAISGAVDYNIKFDNRTYSLYGHLGASHITGTESAIVGKQFSSTHYYQRPDASHVEVDSMRTSLSGYTGSINFEKDGGEHWLWEVGSAMESPGLDLNDAGILGTADDIDSWASIVYRETRPGKYFRNYRIRLEGYSGWNFGGVRQQSELELNFNVQWLNYWSTSVEFEYSTGGQSDASTWGGPLFKDPSSIFAFVSISSNYNAVTSYNFSSWVYHDELAGHTNSYSASLTTRIGDRIRLSISPRYDKRFYARRFIGEAYTNANLDKTEYVFSNYDQSTIAAQVRGSYFFSPNLSLEIYTEPFASSGHYYNYGILIVPGANELNFQDSTSIADDFSSFATNSDYGARSFRSSMVLRWEFSPGSTAYFVWQRNMNDNIEPGRGVRFKSLFDGFSGEGVDMVALKISYWLPVS